MIERNKFFFSLMMCCVLMASSTKVFAALSTDELQILSQKEITELSDDRLLEEYIDVLSEIEASRAFHTTSGFTPKEYKRYKDTYKYRLQILLEVNRRKIELPALLN